MKWIKILISVIILTLLVLFFMNYASSFNNENKEPNGFSLTLGEKPINFNTLSIEKYETDELDEVNTFSIKEEESINQIIDLLEENMISVDDGEALESAPIKDSLSIYFYENETLNGYLLLILDNEYQGNYYYDLYRGNEHYVYESEFNLVPEIIQLIRDN